jgi:hypothetical protein
MRWFRFFFAAALPLIFSACLPPATTQTAAPTILSRQKLAPITLSPPPILVDGKPAITTCPVRVTVTAVRYSSGSVFYEVNDLVPEKADGFSILLPRVEAVTAQTDPPAAESNVTHLHIAKRRTATTYDKIQVHVEINIQRADENGRRHPPKITAQCKTELWGNQVEIVSELTLINDGIPKWSAPQDRIESQKRTDIESEFSPAVELPLSPEWIPAEKPQGKDDPPLPARRPMGHGSFVVKQGI